MACGHNLYLQLCLMVCLLPVSGNSHSTCLLAAFQSGAFAEETIVTFMTCVVFNLFQNHVYLQNLKRQMLRNYEVSDQLKVFFENG